MPSCAHCNEPLDNVNSFNIHDDEHFHTHHDPRENEDARIAAEERKKTRPFRLQSHEVKDILEHLRRLEQRNIELAKQNQALARAASRGDELPPAERDRLEQMAEAMKQQEEMDSFRRWQKAQQTGAPSSGTGEQAKKLYEETEGPPLVPNTK